MSDKEEVDRLLNVLRTSIRLLGLTNREIARTLNIGERTVKTHVSHLLSKLGLQSRTQAALYAVRIGLVATADKP